MCKQHKNYWLFIDSQIHISIKKDNVLFYNPFSGAIVEFFQNDQIIELSKQLKKNHNLRVIAVSESDLKNPVIKDFINQLREYYMGDIIDQSMSQKKPAQIPPIVKIGDLDTLEEGGPILGLKMIEFLDHLTLYINEECQQNCPDCQKAYRQFPWCNTGNCRKKPQEMNLTMIDKIMEIAVTSQLEEMVICGGDTLAFSKLDSLLKILGKFSFKQTFYVHYLNVVKHIDKLTCFKGTPIFLKLLVHFPIDRDQLIAVCQVFKDNQLSMDVSYLLTSESDFSAAEELNRDLSIINAEYHPLYTGNNLAMFEENVFYTKEELKQAKPDFREICSRGFINPLNFGKLSIKADGRIYSDINRNSLGKLGKTVFYEVIKKELRHHRYWKLIRKNVLPCKNCTYEMICPPISNYNTVIGRNNLCWVQSIGSCLEKKPESLFENI
jgi:pseudo-rSAM protein